MVQKSWNLPNVGSLEPGPAGAPCRLLGSVRLTYTLCAFLTNVLHMGMRNMLGLIILRMVKAHSEDALLQAAASHKLDNVTVTPSCGSGVWQQHSYDVVQASLAGI